MKKLVFITGGAKSGKSGFALDCAKNHDDSRLAYIATAEALDGEMLDRIDRHQKERGDSWITIEEPVDVAKVISGLNSKCGAAVLDCLTLWLSNLMMRGLDVDKNIGALLSAAEKIDYPLYVVSNEVGLGIVPNDELSRNFRDRAGALNQRVASAADEAYMMVSGIPIKIKEG